jgi:hypothetical protein
MTERTAPYAPTPSPLAQIARRPRYEPRKESLTAIVSLSEQAKVWRAFQEAGFVSVSEGLREIALAFASSYEVQQAVANELTALEQDTENVA